MVEIHIRVFQNNNNMVRTAFEYSNLHSNGSNPTQLAQIYIQVARICIWMVWILFEWFEFAFECFELAIEHFESCSNDLKLHSSVSNLHSSGSNSHLNCLNPVRMAQISIRGVRICIRMLWIQFEWLEFAFERFKFAIECFESCSNGPNLHYYASNLGIPVFDICVIYNTALPSLGRHTLACQDSAHIPCSHVAGIHHIFHIFSSFCLGLSYCMFTCAQVSTWVYMMYISAIQICEHTYTMNN